MEAARLLGAPLSRRIREVALPLARPAMAAGVALALMETLADFGVSSYFGIQTFTAGIYKAWLAMDNRDRRCAAGHRAAGGGGGAAEPGAPGAKAHALCQRARRARRRRRGPAGAAARAPRLLAWVCAVPVLLGFVLPVLFMLRPLAADWSVLPWDRLCAMVVQQRAAGRSPPCWPCHGAVAGLSACAARIGTVTRAVVQLAGLGYAMPGAVIVVGLLLPVGWLQAVAPDTARAMWMTATGARPGLGLPGALLCGGPAVGAKRLCAHPASLRRLRPHAGHGRLG
jgi:iron(III) transport system permease protein